MMRIAFLATLLSWTVLSAAETPRPLSLWVLEDGASRRSGLREAVAQRLAREGFDVRLVGTWADGVALPEGVEVLCDSVRGADVIVLSVAPEGLGRPGLSPAEAFASWRQTAWTLSVSNPDAQLVLATVLPAGSDATVADVFEFNETVREEATRNPRNVGTFPVRTTVFCELGGFLPRWKDGFWRSDGLALSESGTREAAELVFGVLSPRLKRIGGNAAVPKTNAVVRVAGGAERYVPESYRKGFVRQRVLEIDSRHRFVRGDPPVYDWTNATASAVGPTDRVGRVAYYLELVRGNGGPVRYLWCDMEAFAGTFGEMEVPTGGTRQCRVRRLHVFSNAPGVVNIPSVEDCFEGFVEFSPDRYSADGTCGWRPPAGAPRGMVGWGDRFEGDAPYGCMQVFRCRDELGAKRPPTLLFAWNRFAAEDEGFDEIGIGALSWRGNGKASCDWTFTAGVDELNASAYVVRHLEIWSGK